jgi:hypothetical protein
MSVVAPPRPLGRANPKAERAAYRAMPFASEGLRIGQSRTSGPSISGNRRREEAADAPSVAGQSFRSPPRQHAPRAAARGGEGHPAQKSIGTLQMLFSIARTTRPLNQHIRNSKNPTFVVSGDAYEIAV